MTKLKLLALGILAATAVNTAQAESQWTVGAGVGVINSPYKQYDRDVYPVPVITYEGDNVLPLIQLSEPTRQAEST